MGVGYCLTLRIVFEFARFLCTADKALVQRLFFNMFVAQPFRAEQRCKNKEISENARKKRNKSHTNPPKTFASDLCKICFPTLYSNGVM